MNAHRVRAVAKRIVLGFRRDRRSLGLLFVAPVVVLSLVGAVWGVATERVPTVVVATDRFSGPANVIDRFIASTAIHGRRATFDDGLRQLRSGDVDALVWLDSPSATLHIVIEGSDPLANGTIGAAVQRAVADGLSSLGQLPGPRVVIEQLYGGADYTLLDYLAPVLVAFFAFFFIFLLSAVSFLRERTTGTLERLMATPLRRGELVLGYLAGFSFFALLQAIVILLFTVFVLKVHYRGNLATIFIVEAVLVVGAVSLGLLVSAAARNELQAVQFVPIVLLPQVFLSGLLIPVDQLPDYLRPLSAVLPLTYANEALRSVMIKGYELADPLVLRDIGILVGFGLVMAIGAIASIRREVA
jgi:ABC-2 type transport system permease protein